MSEALYVCIVFFFLLFVLLVVFTCVVVIQETKVLSLCLLMHFSGSD